MTYFDAALLGIIQGLTEFLPISSSAHLVFGKAVLGIESHDIIFEVFVHFGTLLAVLTIFKNDILLLLKALKIIIPFGKKSKNTESETRDGLKLIGLLILGILPAGIIGFLFEDTFEAAFSRLDFVCGALIVTGLILIASKFAIEKEDKISPIKALLIGVAQVAAIFPGISRSGTTITAAMV
ncbi:MAG: undecaprenyl-diphosphate phosphatase, partial [bacterium]